MKILILLILFLSNAVAAPSTGAIANTVQVGGAQNTTSPCAYLATGSLTTTQLVTASSYIGSATAGHYLMMSRWATPDASGQLKVASGKTLKICGIYTFGPSSGQLYTLGYGDTALVLDNTAIPPTNPVYFSSGSGVASSVTGTSGTVSYFPYYGEVPSGKFLFVQTNSTNTIQVFIVGIEQ